MCQDTQDLHKLIWTKSLNRRRSSDQNVSLVANMLVTHINCWRENMSGVTLGSLITFQDMPDVEE